MSINKIRNTYDKARAFTTRPDRLVEAGGFDPSLTKTMTTMQMTSSGTSTDFGDLVESRNLSMATGASSTTRGLFYGGEVSGNSTGVDAIQMASTGNAADFGDLTTARGYSAATSNGTRALCGGGNTPVINVIDFASIASFGNFTDFGNLSVSRNTANGISSPTRAVFGGGTDGTSPSPAFQNVIDFITINSTGNASDFGDLTGNSASMGTCSTPSGQGLFAGGREAPAGNASKIGSQIDVINISSTGNATNFGALSVSFRQGGSNCNESTGLLCSGYQAPAIVNSVNRFSLQAGGISSDFGDLNRSVSDNAAVSGAHNGIDWGSAAVQRPSVTYMPGSGRIISNGGNAPDGGVMEFITISTLGNGVNFGDSAGGNTRAYCGATANATRAMFMGGDTPSKTDLVDAVEIASRGNSFDFGNLTATAGTSQGCASTTRAINAGGVSGSYSNIIEYAAFATAGNFTDFGDLTAATGGPAGASSPTRGLFMGGYTPSADNKIDYITISSTGNATDFGDLTTTIVYAAGGASSTRALRMGGATVNVIDYVTTASTGNATDFGDLTVARGSLGGGSSNTRALAIGGAAPGESNVMDFVTIASTGDAADFGDMTATRGYFSSASDAHGGLQSS